MYTKAKSIIFIASQNSPRLALLADKNICAVYLKFGR